MKNSQIFVCKQELEQIKNFHFSIAEKPMYICIYIQSKNLYIAKEVHSMVHD